MIARFMHILRFDGRCVVYGHVTGGASSMAALFMKKGKSACTISTSKIVKIAAPTGNFEQKYRSQLLCEAVHTMGELTYH